MVSASDLLYVREKNRAIEKNNRKNLHYSPNNFVILFSELKKNIKLNHKILC